MSFKRLIIGEPMPDKNDPKYKERYEQEVSAGKKFAEKSGINWLIVKIQLWANVHKKGFLVIVFGIVIFCFAVNIFNMVRFYRRTKAFHGTAVEKVDSALQKSYRLNNR